MLLRPIPTAAKGVHFTTRSSVIAGHRMPRTTRLAAGASLSGGTVSQFTRQTFDRKTRSNRSPSPTASQAEDHANHHDATAPLFPPNLAARLRALPSTKTKSSWCLRQALQHVCTVDDGYSQALVEAHGLPLYYECVRGAKDDESDKKSSLRPQTCFQSLCRIVAGQFVSGHAAQAVWSKLCQLVHSDLNAWTPSFVIQLTQDGRQLESNLQHAIGVTRRKAESMLALARAFANDGTLTESFLMSSDTSEADLRQALVSIKGIGPWSCDIFIMFYLERPNVVPLGDLGIRKGLRQHFGLKGCLAKGDLCPKKDLNQIQTRLAAYVPYQSVLMFYLWRCADTPVPAAPPSSLAATTTSLALNDDDAAKQQSTAMVPSPQKKRKRAPRMISP